MRRWLLVEEPGAWGPDAVADCNLPPKVSDALLEWGLRLQVRVLLIRRHGRYQPDGTTVFAVTSGFPGRIESFALDDPTEVLDLDLEPLGDDAPVGGQPHDDPLFLVCTNGRHDLCCAAFGRPLAAALDELRPQQTWECSHIGGDRFAGNALWLPGGLYLGRVGPADAAGVVEALEAGRLPLPHYRGRAGWPFVVQAADYLLREDEGDDDIGAFDYLRSRRLADDRVEAVFRAADGSRRRVEVEVRPADEAARLTCSAEQHAHAPRYRLVGVTRD